MSGYKLVHGPEQGPYLKQAEKTRGTDVSYSLGMVINKEGVVSSTIWGRPAFKAGLDVGTEIEAVNAEAYSSDSIKAAILAAKGTKVRIRLTVKNNDRFRDALLDYHDGSRYPRLQKLGTGGGGLDKLLTPR